MKENEYVKTAIRWRSTDENEDVIIQKINEHGISFGSQTKTFCFDHVIDSSDQNEVYDILIKPLVGKALEGYDCTFLASGQTGSGKTYTMGFESSVKSEINGMTLRVLNSIFSYADAERVEVSISFVEVYNDQAFDLLGKNPQEPLKKDLGISGANRKSVQNESDVLAFLTQGTKNRRVRGTRTNATSSRSHAVFSIKLRIQNTDNKIRESVINLVDLAGSECVDKTGNTSKESIIEGKSINESLSAFKRVIIAMSSGAGHIPFRDSVITYILRKSLEINCYLTLLGCVSPFRRDYGETLSTLSFVADAKLIKRTPQLNAVINESQNTPERMSFQTPISSKRSASPFSRPWPLSSIQNKLPPVPMSEPRNIRFGRRSIANSTKKTERQSLCVDRFKTVNRVLPRTPSRKIPDSSLKNNKIKNSNLNEKTTNTPEVKRMMERLANETKKIMDNDNDNGFNRNIMDVIGVALSNINFENSMIIGSFHSTPNQANMLSTVMENECSDDVTLNDQPIQDQIFSISSTEEPIIDPIPSFNVSISCDHVVKNIFFEVSEATGDNDTIISVPTPKITSPKIALSAIASPKTASPKIASPTGDNDTIIDVSTPKIASPKITLPEIAAPKTASPTGDNDTIIDVPTPKIASPKITLPEIASPKITLPEITSAKIASPKTASPKIVSPDSTQYTCAIIKDLCDDGIGGNSVCELQGNPLNQTPIFIDDVLNNKTLENTSPIIKNITNTNMRTPIGKLIIRRVAHSNLFDCTQYAVEIIHKVPSRQEIIPEKSPPSFGMDYDYEVIEIPKTKAKPLTTSSPISSEASHSVLHSRKSPRLVLHRVRSIKDYNRHEEVPLQAVTRLKRKLCQIESDRTKDIIPEASSPFLERKYDGIKKPNNNIYPFSTSSPIANKVAHRHHFLKYPRLILQRLPIQDYSPQAVTQLKRKGHQNKSAHTKGNGKKSEAQHKEMELKILDILNTANEDGLRKKLATIGAKKAYQIFSYRAAKGKFRSLDGLLKMPFWSKKTHERFIAHNIFV